MALAGVSTLGVIFSYAVEETAGEKPTSFTALTRINSIGEIALSTETIDASALEDLVEKSIAGRQSSGGNWDVVINMTDDTVAEWTTLMTAATTANADGKGVWFQVAAPNLAKGFFVVAELPKVLPMPAFDQNGLLTMTISLTIADYKGLDTKVEVA